jgi:hypothetical protein
MIIHGAVAEARAMQAQQAHVGGRLEVGFQVVYLRSGVCGGVVVFRRDGTREVCRALRPAANMGIASVALGAMTYSHIGAQHVYQTWPL